MASLLSRKAIHNKRTQGRGIAVFDLTAERQAFTVAPAEIPELDVCERYWVYDFFGKKAFSVGRNETHPDTIEAGAAAWYVILPQAGKRQHGDTQTGDTQTGDPQIGAL